MTEPVAELPSVRKANKAQAAEFFGTTLPTMDKWIRDGLPVVQRGARGISWIIDLHLAAEWRYSSKLPTGGIDPESLTPGERKLWYDGETRRRDLQVRDSELLESGDVQETVSTAFSAVAQSLLALPDNLERRTGLTPDQAESAEQVIHETLQELVDRLRLLATVTIE